MEQGTINKDITLKYDTDNDNLVVSSTYVATKKSVDDLSNKVNENESKISTVDKIVTDLCNEVKTDKETIEELFSRIKWVERVFIITFCLIMLNCFYVIFTLMQKG